MKVLIVKNQLDIDITDEVTGAFTWLSSKFGIPFETEYMDVQWTDTYEFKGKNSQGFNVWGSTFNKDRISKLIPQGKYEAVIYVFNPKTFDYSTGYVTGYTSWIQVCEGTEYAEIAGQASFNGRTLENYFTHEMMHVMTHKAIRKSFFIKDEMDIHNGVPYDQDSNRDSTTGNYAAQFKNLAPYLQSIMQPTYKYFKPSEVVGLKPELCEKLDAARGLAGVPFSITSGFRTPAENVAVGGVPNSAHLKGEAADLKCSDASARWKILNALLKVGFVRLEIAAGHIHCDISTTLPQNIVDFSKDA